jgi:hypothetical protein
MNHLGGMIQVNECHGVGQGNQCHVGSDEAVHILGKAL